MKELRKGVNIYVEDLKKNVDLHAAIICGTADLPAKALFLGMNQYNDRFGCQVCVQEVRTVDHRRVYPFKSNLNLRTEKDVLESSIQAVACGFPVCGVKGLTILSKICYKFVSSTAVDVMHNTHEGVVKKLIDLWFNSKYSNEIFSISHFTNLVDDKLCSIKPPSFISRRPRTIKDHFPYWKALECCPICSRIGRVQRLWPCMHRMCVPCVEQITNNLCAVCREPITSYLPPHLMANYARPERFFQQR
uniref:RING-type domain-containing protein n=1 Tax=Trichogramma kaykai TaxID=54128 RepID=A0ABD2WJ36_9HYME